MAWLFLQALRLGAGWCVGVCGAAAGRMPNNDTISTAQHAGGPTQTYVPASPLVGALLGDSLLPYAEQSSSIKPAPAIMP